ncbi:hypothetical protein [Craterilacuibacter sp.]|jgi:hypothetical protein|uniref:hypothetical protein n=1 Tax=Craterilacuibacter sp. TaxID=2870909 RepID=UPI003F2D4740
MLDKTGILATESFLIKSWIPKFAIHVPHARQMAEKITPSLREMVLQWVEKIAAGACTGSASAIGSTYS